MGQGRRRSIDAPRLRRVLLLLAFALLGVEPAHAGELEIVSIETPVSDLDRACDFYTQVLHFHAQPEEARDDGQRIATLSLGEETLQLRQPATVGRPVPPGMESNDVRFQHLAIVVSDMEHAYRQLLAHGVTMVSDGPQTLPRSNYDAAGIAALYFRDPDGHFLELIRFPADKGEPRWHRRNGRLFLGIDHTAIVVRDLAASRHFYRDAMGLAVVGLSLNYGPEQERLNGVPGSRVDIVSFRGPRGPGLELLNYVAPRSTGIDAASTSASDLLQMKIHFSGERAAGWPDDDRDPDGHALEFSTQPWRVTAQDAQLQLAREALRQHWPRYLMEGAELGIFMLVALYLTILLEHPDSPVHRRIRSSLLRRALMGLGIGGTVIALIYSTWGRQSGAQFNPAVTLAMYGLDRINTWDAVFYVVAQFLGGWLGVVLGAGPVRRLARHPSVDHVVTKPGPRGTAVAFAAECFISFLILFSLLQVMHRPELRSWIGVAAGLHLWAFITFESPFSGMSLNPARTLASALPARNYAALWMYFIAPPMAMGFAALVCRKWIDA